MPQIPIYEEKVGLDSGGTPTPQLQGPMQSASGMNIAQAQAGLTKTVSEGVSEVAHLVAYKQRLDSQEKVDNLSEQAATEMQGKLHGEGGLLTRQADAARGITSGTPGADKLAPGDQGATQPGIKFEDSFDGFASDLKQRYLDQASTDYEKRALNHALDAHERVYRNAVIEHEGQQAKVARSQAHEAAIDALRNTAVDATDPSEITNEKGNGLLDKALTEREVALRNAGHSEQAVIDAVKQKTANSFADAVVHANLERDPEKAQAMLDGMKGKISNADAANLQAHVDGKMIAIRADAINDQIAKDPQSRNADGTFNLGYVENKAKELASTRPEAEQTHLVNMAKQQALMADSALAQQKQKATRGVLDGFSELRDKNIPYGEAEKIVLTKYGASGMFGPSEIDKLRLQGMNIYKRSPDAIEARLNAMDPEQKRGYADSVNIIKTKYKNQTGVIPGQTDRVKLSDSMIQQLKVIAPKMSRQQMIQWTSDGLKEVPTKPAWLTVFGHKFGDGEMPAWQAARQRENK